MAAPLQHHVHQHNAAMALALGGANNSAYAHPENAIPAGEAHEWKSSLTYCGLVPAPMAGTGGAAFANVDRQRNLLIAGTANGGGRFAALWEHPYTVQTQRPAYHAYNAGTPVVDPRLNGTIPNAGPGGGTCDATIIHGTIGAPIYSGIDMNLYRPYMFYPYVRSPVF